MAVPRLPLDQSVEADVYLAVCDVLREDPALKQVVRTWEVLDGSHSTIQPPATAGMPWVCLVPGPSEMFVAAADSYQIDFSVAVLFATPGLDGANQLNLWGAIRSSLVALKPHRNSTVGEFLRRAHSPMGSFVHKVTSPGLGPHPLPTATRPNPEQNLMGSARVLLSFHVPF